MIPIALTIAGSDSSGGAGIQADLKTFSRLKVYGTSVITALTAQNTAGVSGILETPAGFVGLQCDAVMRDLRPSAVKTGMMANAAIIETVAEKLRQYELKRIVVDPVLISTSGMPLLHPNAVETFKRVLLPLATIVTPNLSEAGALTGLPVCDLAGMEEAARRLHDLGARYVLVKGGHLEGAAVDVLFDGRRFTRFSAHRLPMKDAHGTGCVLSASIAAYLSLGLSLPDAVRGGKRFVTLAIRRALRLGKGKPPCDPVGVRANRLRHKRPIRSKNPGET